MVNEGDLRKTSDERRAALDAALTRYGAAGWRIENRSDHQATVAKGKDTSHLLHLFLSIITLGLWLIAWLGFGVLGGVKRRLVTVDEFGNVVDQKV